MHRLRQPVFRDGKLPIVAVMAAAGWTALCHGAWAVGAESGFGAASSATAGASGPGAFEQPSDVGRIIQQLDAEIASGGSGPALGPTALRLVERIFAAVPAASGADLAMIQALPAHFKRRALSERARRDSGAADRFFAVGNLLAALGEHAAPAEAQSGLPAGQKALPYPPGQGASEDAVRSALPPPSKPPAAPAMQAPEVVASNQAAAPQGDTEHGAGERAALSMAATALLLRRGEDNLRRHDVIAARLLFQRAVDDPSGIGATGYAKTYDPTYLAEAGARYAQADAERAAEYYRRAIALGNREAPALLTRLEIWQAKSASAGATSRN